MLAPHAYLVVIGIAHNRHKHIDISGMCKYLYCYVYKVVNSPRNVTLWCGSSNRALALPHPPTPCGPLDQMLQFFHLNRLKMAFWTLFLEITTSFHHHGLQCLWQYTLSWFKSIPWIYYCTAIINIHKRGYTVYSLTPKCTNMAYWNAENCPGDE